MDVYTSNWITPNDRAAIVSRFREGVATRLGEFAARHPSLLEGRPHHITAKEERKLAKAEERALVKAQKAAEKEAERRARAPEVAERRRAAWLSREQCTCRKEDGSRCESRIGVRDGFCSVHTAGFEFKGGRIAAGCPNGAKRERAPRAPSAGRSRTPRAPSAGRARTTRAKSPKHPMPTGFGGRRMTSFADYPY